jgi:CBS domain-containing protein
MLSIVGYELCPAEMMASNPLWCKSEKSGRNNIPWIHSPGEKGILMCSIFFDYDFIYGDKELVSIITETVLKHK